MRAGDGIVVAFSGGPDSCALLLGLALLRHRLGIEVLAAHLDHGLDPDSGSRRERAARLAARLGVPFRSARREVAALRRPGTTIEEAARIERYRFLEHERAAAGARFVATAHHQEDQLETVLLRLLQGTGPFGLAGIRERTGSLVRPLLGLPRAALREAVHAAGLTPVHDPTNERLEAARNRLRLLVLPVLLAREPDLPERAALLARTAARAGAAIDDLLRRRLARRCAAPDGGVALALDVGALRELPPALLPIALAALHRWHGAPYPPSAAACRELARQMAAGGRIGADCGGGFRWRERDGRLHLLAPSHRESPSRILSVSGGSPPRLVRYGTRAQQPLGVA